MRVCGMCTEVPPNSAVRFYQRQLFEFYHRMSREPHFNPDLAYDLGHISSFAESQFPQEEFGRGSRQGGIDDL